MKKYIIIGFILIQLIISEGCFISYPTTITMTTTQPASTQYVTVTNTTPLTEKQTSTKQSNVANTVITSTTTETTPLSISNPTPTPPPATGNLIPELETVTPSDQLIDRQYKWKYGGREWTWELSILQSLYDYYKALPRSPTDNYSIYVTHPLDDKYIDSIVSKLKDAAQQEDYNSFQTVSFAAAFVQSLDYTSDAVTTGFDEYPRYPIETLVDDGGDCEDTSILLAAIIQDMGYGEVLIRFPATADYEGHMAVGVKGNDNIDGTYYTYEGAKYFYIETTGTGWEVGQLPKEFKDADAYLYGMVPVPILTHDWTSQGEGLYVKLAVNVKNLGSADADNVQIFAGFDAGSDQVWNSKYSKPFNIGIDETWKVTLYIKPAWGEYTRLLVQIIYNGQVVDESYGKWVQIPSF